MKSESNSIYDEECPDCNLAGDFTAQCTDECVVVACEEEHDEGHDIICNIDRAELEAFANSAPPKPPGPCPWGGPLKCKNLDRMIRTEFFPELRTGNSPPSRTLTLPYDPKKSFEMLFPDDYRHQSTCSIEKPSSESGRSSEANSLLFSDNGGISSSPSLPSSPNTEAAGSGIGLSDSRSRALKCHWADCQEIFMAPNDLAAHVNTQHLKTTPLPYQQQVQQYQQPYSFEGSFPYYNPADPSNPCQWRNCTSAASSFPVAGPSSSENGTQIPLEVLMQHLLQDHLGFTPNAGLEDFSNMMQQKEQPSPVNDFLPMGEPTSSMINDFSAGNGDGNHHCQWQSCAMTFGSDSELTSHINQDHVGSGKPHYDCWWSGCDRHGERGFTSKQKICRHIQTHTGHKPFQCQICSQSFSEAATLQQHMRRHTQEKPYVCDFPGCGKAFSITGALTIHKRVHNGHKPFKCTFCDKAFSESSNLAKHLRTHTGEKPYSCTHPGCTKAFARPDQLSRHMSVHVKKKRGNL